MTPMDHSQPQLPCPWNFLGKNTGVGCHSLLQGIFPTRGLSLSLPHCGQTLYRLSYQGSAVNARQHRGARPRLHADSQRRILAPSHLISGGAIGGGGRGENLLSRHPVGGEHQAGRARERTPARRRSRWPVGGTDPGQPCLGPAKPVSETNRPVPSMSVKMTLHLISDGTPLQYSCLENPIGGGAW